MIKQAYKRYYSYLRLSANLKEAGISTTMKDYSSWFGVALRAADQAMGTGHFSGPAIAQRRLSWVNRVICWPTERVMRSR